MAKNTENNTTNGTNGTLSDKKELFLKKLFDSDFNISKACELSRIGRQTYYNWLEDDEFRQKVDDLEEKDMDDAESALRKLIKQGNVTAIIFKLKTKGRKRGYNESTQLELVKPISELNFDEI